METKKSWQCRIAPSLGGGFAGTPNEVWGTVDYTEKEKPTVFFGMYGFRDFYALWRHKGEKAVLWAGSDIRHLRSGFWLNEQGSIRLSPRPLARWLNENAQHYVENQVEYEALKEFGIDSKIVPSFLGNIEDFGLSFEPSDKPKLYTSISGDDFELYGWNKLPNLAKKNPDIEFHLYGNAKDFKFEESNIFVHGRVSQEQMNEETKKMQGALRLTEFDGFSEILAKSILWGQYPISLIPYKYMLTINQIGMLKEFKKPNKQGRNHYKQIINNYTWNVKKHG